MAQAIIIYLDYSNSLLTGLAASSIANPLTAYSQHSSHNASF